MFAPESTTPEWVTGPVVDHDENPYASIVRAPDDPERRPRYRGQDVAPHLTIAKTSQAEWATAIAAHLADGVPRTLNRIAVEMLDKTADVVFETTFDAALWWLVAEKHVEHTLEVPVLFRRTEAA